MATQQQNNLLDYWSPKQWKDAPPAVQTVPVGFIATTFTFRSEFFDEECLSRFLMLETEKENDGAAYLIEREEKLAGLQAGVVMVDQHNCTGARSLRWDLIPCRVRKGILHAKISVLYWSTSIRVIISSANLTPTGYCYNQEIFGTLDYFEGSDADPALLLEVLDYLSDLSTEHCGKIARQRVNTLAGKIRKQIADWNMVSPPKRPEIDVKLLLVAPGRADGWNAIKQRWGSASPPWQIWITSPFFDTEYRQHGPSEKIKEVLMQRGEVQIHYQVTSPGNNERGEKILDAPGFLSQENKKHNHLIYFHVIDKFGVNEKNVRVPRPLHLKSVWLSGRDQHAMVIGSSNFTSAAWGLGDYVNYEANLMYVVRDQSSKAYKQLEAAHLNGVPVNDEPVLFETPVNEDEPLSIEFCGLPLFFGEAVITKTSGGFVLVLNFCPDETVPEDFVITYQQDTLLTHQGWQEKQTPVRVELPWHPEKLPDELAVTWTNDHSSTWPVLIDHQHSLPPVDELKNLSFEALLYILSTSQPLHRLLDKLKKLHDKKHDGQRDIVDLNAHKLVDTSTFLLQRTRRLSYALRSLRERLEKPVFTKQSLDWRINGPVGVKSLKAAIEKEIPSKLERDFMIAEVCLELATIQPATVPGSLSAREVKAAIRMAVSELTEDMTGTSTGGDNYFSTYCGDAVNHALNVL